MVNNIGMSVDSLFPLVLIAIPIRFTLPVSRFDFDLLLTLNKPQIHMITDILITDLFLHCIFFL